MVEPHSAYEAAADQGARRLFVYNGGFLTQRSVRRILTLAGFPPKIGLPSPGDMVGVWGQSPTAYRGERIAAQRKSPLLRVEDAFLRSLFPGRAGEAPVGLLLDPKGVHFDPTRPSALETLLAEHPLDDSALLARARAAIGRIKEHNLTKYCANPRDAAQPAPGYVLVIDQTRDDAAVKASGVRDADFQEMLVLAQEENPGVPILIKTHPESQRGHRSGYFGQKDVNERVALWDQAISPWHLFEGAVAVYTMSSQMGFEAIYAGHKPRVFGQPFYAGWGLTQDERPVARRQRKLTKAQLFAAAMILYPTWYDPQRDQLCEIEDILGYLEAKTRSWREDHKGWRGQNIRLWKRPHFQKIFGKTRRMQFGNMANDRPNMVWGAAKASDGVWRVEDGFLRSRGLGAELVPPLSLILDDLGIYYDPNRPSRLEHHIAARAQLRPEEQTRVERLLESIRAQGLSKYNLSGPIPDLPMASVGERILIPGQVSDDASILLGTADLRSNQDLIKATRAANPDAFLIYKEHPDVVAGLREGAVPNAADYVDLVIKEGDISQLLETVDAVWTLTSLTGFEALIRGCKVTTLAAPFYAGWGLTTDLGSPPSRRRARPSLYGLAYATLIDYPRYFDPLSNEPCSVERAVERLSKNALPRGAGNRFLSKLQGALASRPYLWR